jgi:hypothetical protein
LFDIFTLIPNQKYKETHILSDSSQVKSLLERPNRIFLRMMNQNQRALNTSSISDNPALLALAHALSVPPALTPPRHCTLAGGQRVIPAAVPERGRRPLRGRGPARVRGGRGPPARDAQPALGLQRRRGAQPHRVGAGHARYGAAQSHTSVWCNNLGFKALGRKNCRFSSG